MIVYQLKLKDHDLVLDPVFKTLKGINIYKNKYNNRTIEIVKKNIDTNNSDYIYRVSIIDDEGYSLIDSLFESIEKAEKFIKEEDIKTARILKEYFSSKNKFYESLIEV